MFPGETEAVQVPFVRAGLQAGFTYPGAGGGMKVKELQKLLADCDPEATVLISGFETTTTACVAEVDIIELCTSVPAQDVDPMSGDRRVSRSGAQSVWLGWSRDYRTDSFLNILNNPDE